MISEQEIEGLDRSGDASWPPTQYLTLTLETSREQDPPQCSAYSRKEFVACRPLQLGTGAGGVVGRGGG